MNSIDFSQDDYKFIYLSNPTEEPPTRQIKSKVQSSADSFFAKVSNTITYSKYKITKLKDDFIFGVQVYLTLIVSAKIFLFPVLFKLTLVGGAIILPTFLAIRTAIIFLQVPKFAFEGAKLPEHKVEKYEHKFTVNDYPKERKYKKEKSCDGNVLLGCLLFLAVGVAINTFAQSKIGTILRTNLNANRGFRIMYFGAQVLGSMGRRF